MLNKTVYITIPSDTFIPDIISTFSPEENYLMLKIGSDSLIEGRKSAVNLTNEELYKKIENDFKKDIEKLDNEIKMEKQVSVKTQDKLVKMYESQLEQLHKKLDTAMSKIITYEENSKSVLEEEVNKIKERYDLLLKEKDVQNQLNREVFDKATQLLNKTVNKSSISIGDSGENIFENLADTFRDFVDYKLEYKGKQSHKGDFHLYFKDFNILVDSKNYSGCVSKKEIIKIISDLNTNSNMTFGWLVSLNSNICEHNKFPITPKWITTDDGVVKCILMINNLLDNKDPRNMLRQAWQMCNEFYRLTKSTVVEDAELEEYRGKFIFYKKQINSLQDRIHDLKRSVNTSLNIVKNIDNDLLIMLSNISDEIVNETIGLNEKVKEWWDKNIEYVEDDNSILISTDIWFKFRKDNKEYIVDNKLSIDKFKDIITGLINSSNYVEKTKKGAIEFIGFKWIEEEKEKEEKKIDNIVIEKSLKKLKQLKHPQIKQNTDYYFDELTDKQILNDYENELNNIMSISNPNIRPWQIISLLMRYKIITKRNEARGFDQYKETEEYKNKIKSNTLNEMA
jgi:hypothetical protein